MIENWFAIALIGAASFISKDPRLQHLMMWLLVAVELYLLKVPFVPNGAFFDAYYLGLATVITAFACLCISTIHGTGSILLSTMLAVWAMINALMFTDSKWIYFIHSNFGDMIVLMMIGLAWYAAAKSRKG